MATSIVPVTVPASGDGPAADVSSLVGAKTVTLTGTFLGTYTLLASHDGQTFVPVLTFNADGLEEVRTTLPDSYASVRVRSSATNPSGVSLTVAGELGVGQNFFSPLTTFPAGSAGGTGAVVDLQTLFPPTGLEEEVNFICNGGLVGSVLVEGSNDGAELNPVGTFQGGTSARLLVGAPPSLGFEPLPTHDKLRYVRVTLQGQAASDVVVTVGGRIPASGGGVGTPLSLYTTTGGVTTQATGAFFVPAFGQSSVVAGDGNVGLVDPSASNIFIYGSNSGVGAICSNCVLLGTYNYVDANTYDCFAFSSDVATAGIPVAFIVAFNSGVDAAGVSLDNIFAANNSSVHAGSHVVVFDGTVYRGTNIFTFNGLVGTPLGDTTNVFAWGVSNVGDTNAGCHDVVALGSIQIDDGCSDIVALGHCRYQRGTTQAFTFSSNVDFNCSRVVAFASSFVDFAQSNTFAFNSFVYGASGGNNVAFNCQMSDSLFTATVNCVGFNGTMGMGVLDSTTINGTVGGSSYDCFSHISTVGPLNGYVTAFDAVVENSCYNVIAFNAQVDNNSQDSFVVGNKANLTQYVSAVSFYSQHGSPYNSGAVALFSTLGASSQSPVAIWGTVGSVCDYSLTIFGTIQDGTTNAIAIGRQSVVSSGCNGGQAYGRYATVNQAGEVVFGAAGLPVGLFHAVGNGTPLDLFKFDVAGAAVALDSAMYLLYKDGSGTLVMNKVLVETSTGYLHVPV